MRSKSGVCEQSAVHFAAVADFNHEDAKRSVLYVANDSIIPNSVAPVCAELWACQCFAHTARVIQHSQALSEKACNAFCFVLVQFCELLTRRRRQVNPPNQGRAPLPLE